MTPEAPGRHRVLVVIPTYQEAGTIRTAVAGARAALPDADVLVVDDNSPDGTGDIADELAVIDPQVQVLHRPGKQGLGAAYKAAFAWALERNVDVVVQMDSDGSHDPADLPRLVAALGDVHGITDGGADLVLGSRWVPGGAVRDWPAWRRGLSMGGNLYVRLVLRLPVRDATGGYRAFRVGVLRATPLEEVSSAGYCFQVDLVLRAVQAGFRVREIPIVFRERTVGESKMSRAIVREALGRVTWWALTNRRASLRGTQVDPDGTTQGAGALYRRDSPSSAESGS
ncbi:MAG: polyprenol monophosphomannose synthase [Geodermatophilaceae bacterium]|nr:polyprenol monophosphomannose synthase [Geodermatophilaceae bacterium]